LPEANIWKVLLVEDDEISRKAINAFLQNQLEYTVSVCCNGFEALDLLDRDYHPVVLTDIKMPQMDGISLLKEIKSRNTSIEVILMTGYGDMETSIQALRLGAVDYLLKPLNIQELAIVLKRLEDKNRLIKENTHLRESIQKLKEHNETAEERSRYYKSVQDNATGIGRIGIFSNSMRLLVELTEKLHKDRSVPVLIEGETGTGKEIIARLVHYSLKGQETHPFISINCAALPPTLFESELFGYEPGSFTGSARGGGIGKIKLADGGTLFLDEIGELPLDVQPKLLRFLEQREFYRVGGTKTLSVDVRIICATNVDLPNKVKLGLFRADLFYRLNTGRIYVSSLRDRKEEIGPLSQLFLEQFSREKKRQFQYIEKDALELLESYPWPGNIRELQNCIERVVLLFDERSIKTRHLRFLKTNHQTEGQKDTIIEEMESTVPAFSKPFSLDEWNKKIITNVWRQNKKNVSETARFLGLTRTQLYTRLKRYKLI